MNKVTFTVPCTDGSTCIVTGWELRGGAVMHRELSWPDEPSSDLWVVADPVSGAKFCRPGSMGAALRAYRALVAGYGTRWESALADQRKKLYRRWLDIQKKNAETEVAR